MVLRKEDLQSINPATVPAQSAPLSIQAVCRKRQILPTTPRYLPPLTRTTPARKRHCYSRAIVLQCDRQTIKQFWKTWRAPINVISYIILFLKAINTLLDTCSNCRLRDPEFAKKHATSSTVRRNGFQNLNTCGPPVSKNEFSRTPFRSKRLI